MRIFFLVALLFLSSCSLPVGTDTTQSSLIPYDWGQFTIQVPKSWNEAKKQDIPLPKNGTVVLAYVSPEITNGFSNNLLIIKEKLTGLMSSKKYSELNHIQTTKSYLEYTKLLDSSILFSDGDESKVYGFEARYNQNTPRKKFLQTSKICTDTVYLMTVSISLEKDITKYKEILQSFTCK